ncbi:BRO-N domain-containing protein [Bacillus toyonensis]|uniref:BRO-N domain-containing protein n=1 Tax=Bacillus toyonensis TaxID=155322 RepID=UPI000BF0DD82|nr:hypothetical protein CN629_03070 [Bacillus toyonensis]
MTPIFEYEGNKVRTVIKEGEPCFVVKDVCAILNLSNSRKAISSLDDDEKRSKGVQTLDYSQGIRRFIGNITRVYLEVSDSHYRSQWLYFSLIFCSSFISRIMLALFPQLLIVYIH